jgi:hypothetical protein
MYTFLQTVGLPLALRREATPLVLSLAVAELFYKFHSFLLECVAFLFTWYAASWLWGRVIGRYSK